MRTNLVFATLPFQVNKCRRSLLCFAFFISLIKLFEILGFITFSVGYIIPVILFVLPIIDSVRYYKPNFSKLYFFFFVYLILNVLFTNPPRVFQAWPRLGLFVILLLSVSPVLQSKGMRFYRINCLKYFLILLLPFTFISFFCYFLGINFFTSQYGEVDYTVRVGGFSALFKHSMILGPMAAISTCTSLWVSLKSPRRKFIWWTIAFCCLGATFLSASRASAIGAILGVLIILLYSSSKKSKGVQHILLVSIIATATFSLWGGLLSGLETKTQNRDMGTFESRTDKFEARLSEFTKSPIIGMGFSSIDPNGKDYFDTESGAVEPGSSWLGILSMTGIIGLLFMLRIVWDAYKSLLRSNSIYKPLLLGYLTFFVFHMLFEGYVFAGGSVLCFLLWLVIGVSSDLKYLSNKKQSV